MSFVVGRDGNISLLRVGTLVGIVGVLLIIGGIAAYVLDQNSYKTPLNVDPYPGAESWGNVREGGSSRRAVFLVSNASPEEVTSYYEQRLREFSGDSSEVCTRVPATGEFEQARNDSSVAPYSYTCLFQRNGLRASQQTTIRIQPGVSNPDPQQNTLGKTVVEQVQRWQP